MAHVGLARAHAALAAGVLVSIDGRVSEIPAIRSSDRDDIRVAGDRGAVCPDRADDPGHERSVKTYNSMMLKPIEWTGSCVRLLDQTKLPGRTEYVEITDEKQMHDAIRRLVVRGAP